MSRQHGAPPLISLFDCLSQSRVTMRAHDSNSANDPNRSAAQKHCRNQTPGLLRRRHLPLAVFANGAPTGPRSAGPTMPNGSTRLGAHSCSAVMKVSVSSMGFSDPAARINRKRAVVGGCAILQDARTDRQLNGDSPSHLAMVACEASRCSWAITKAMSVVSMARCLWSFTYSWRHSP